MFGEGGVSDFRTAYSRRSHKALGLSHIESISSRMWRTFLTRSRIAAVLSRLAAILSHTVAVSRLEWNHSLKDMRLFLQSIFASKYV